MKNIKYLFDFFFALFLLILLSPLWVILSLLIRISLGPPIFFSQLRPGLNEKLFKIYKFRTMVEIKDEKGNLLPDHQRLTKIGRLIRSFSLDELPQLINVLKGELSIVGPRPLLIEYLELYSEQEKKRHSVRPGITGLAQINGRNAINWKQKFQFDIWYVENWSFCLDFKILFLTLLQVVKKKGVQYSPKVTMPPYNGFN